MRPPIRFVVLTVLTLCASAAVAAYLLGRNGSDDGWNTVMNEASGIRVSHPPGWTVQPFGRYCRRVGPGLLVANAGARTFRIPKSPNGCTTHWDLSGLPDDYVLVDMSLISFPGPLSLEDTELPFELSRLRRSPEQSYAYARIVRGGDEYFLRVWTGKNASIKDTDALARVIRSIELIGLNST